MTLTPDIRAARAEIVRGRFALVGIHLPLTAMEGAETGTLRDARGDDVLIVDEPGARTDAETLAIARLVADILNRAGGFPPEEITEDGHQE